MGADHSTASLTPGFTALADLASARVGGRAIAANDEFFAPKSQLLKPRAGHFRPRQVHDPRQMDGRLGDAPPAHPRPRLVRRRTRHARRPARHQRRHEPLHRQLPVALLPRGDRQRAAAVTRDVRRRRRTVGRRSSPKSPLRGNGDNFLPVADHRPWTHVRLNIFPDGGVARLRVYGEVAVDWARMAPLTSCHRTSPRSPTAVSSSAPATCTSAPRTT